MRLFLAALVAAALAAAAGAAGAYRASFTEAGVDGQLLSRIPMLAEEFAGTHTAELELALADLPQWLSDPVLVDTVGSYPESRQYCDMDTLDEELGLAKAETWHELAICGGLSALPQGFFERPPYLHLSGRSYVMMAILDDPGHFGGRDWIEGHKQFLHVSELKQAARFGIELLPAERLAAELDGDSLHALARGASPVIAGERVLVARGGNSQPATATYGAYPRGSFERFLEATPLTVAAYRPGDVCLAVEGSVCFDVSPRGVQRRMHQAMVLAAGSLGLFMLAAVLSATRRVRLRRREQDARIFTLQTLSHEIRTPATSLALSLEPIRRHFDELPEPVQPAFLRLCDGVQRLQRVVQASTQYLRGELCGRSIDFAVIPLASVNELVRGLPDDDGRELKLHLLEEEVAVRLDPYWVGVCLQNLVDNAFAHGAEPVRVSVSRRGQTVVITVQDSGCGLASSFEQMKRPFCRAEHSTGLGFGLAVVDRLMTSMGGSLRYQPKPTRFSLVLRDVISR